MEVLKLLQSQVRCLRKLLDYSEEFLLSCSDGEFSTFTKYDQKRAKIFKALELYDHKITEVANTLSPEEKTSELIELLKAEALAKNSLIQAIFVKDQKIILAIQNERERLIRLASSSDKNKEMLNKFKSTWVPESGEKLDGRI